MEEKLKEIIVTLLKAGPDRKGGSGRNSKTTVFRPFPTSGQTYVFDANDDQNYLMLFKSSWDTHA